MISFKLWRALSRPPRRHPLFQYVLSGTKREEPQVTSGFVVWVLMLAALIFIIAVIVQPVMWFILAMFVSLNSFYAARWVLRIARTIVQEKESRRYDLLASLPVGLLGTSWALTTGAVHKRSSFRWLPYLVLMIAIIACIALCGLSTLILTLLEELSENEITLARNLDFARSGIIVMPFVILFYFDHVYSILTAIVFGQIVSIDVRDVAEGQIRALTGFLVIQLLTYIFSLGIALLVLPGFLTASGFTEVEHLVMIGFAGVLIFIMLRESIVFGLWRYLTISLEADHKEMALVLKPFYQAEAILRESEQARVRHLDARGQLE